MGIEVIAAALHDAIDRQRQAATVRTVNRVTHGFARRSRGFSAAASSRDRPNHRRDPISRHSRSRRHAPPHDIAPVEFRAEPGVCRIAVLPVVRPRRPDLHADQRGGTKRRPAGRLVGLKAAAPRSFLSPANVILSVVSVILSVASVILSVASVILSVASVILTQRRFRRAATTLDSSLRSEYGVLAVYCIPVNCQGRPAGRRYEKRIRRLPRPQAGLAQDGQAFGEWSLKKILDGEEGRRW